ncbi:hypothetical protein MSG28_005559 [Choristoneura fumiferana]|uniref:Uncharacterized protein n=1 Tax=Choristoneura fumiferana TaxID=7141 RepID=A0ACC0L0A9_CHOFU|nr:hypothetical protein MSG28_005559 [Choristoneura fumiferana]
MVAAAAAAAQQPPAYLPHPHPMEMGCECRQYAPPILVVDKRDRSDADHEKTSQPEVPHV